jgi:S1-C subfamily serine protease
VKPVKNDFTPSLPSREVLERTIFIKGASFGAGYICSFEGRQFIVTAQHVSGNGNESDILYQCGGSFRSLEAKVLVQDVNNDLAIIESAVDFNIQGTAPKFADLDQMYLGHPVVFLGFPMLYKGMRFSNSNAERPVPFVKSAIISMFDFDENKNLIAYDALNNLGFSGGPVVMTDIDGVRWITGIVTGHREEIRRVEHSKDNRGSEYEYRENTGIMIGVSTSRVKELLREASSTP